MGATAIDQKHAALQVANRSRSSAVDLRRTLRALDRRQAALEAARLLCEEPERVGHQRVHAFLEAVPGIGDSKVRRMLTRGRWPVWPLRRVRELTERQRLMLVDALCREAER